MQKQAPIKSLVQANDNPTPSFNNIPNTTNVDASNRDEANESNNWTNDDIGNVLESISEVYIETSFICYYF